MDCLAEWWPAALVTGYLLPRELPGGIRHNWESRYPSNNSGTVEKAACHPVHQLNPSALGTFTRLGLES